MRAMDAWLDFARGPAFLSSFSFMVLGLIRHLGLKVWNIVRAMRRAGDKTFPYRQTCIATVKWLIPVGKLKHEFLFSVTSVLFHLAILIVPIFLVGHIALWRRGIGGSWPGISNSLADVLTIMAMVTAVALVVQRVSARATRKLSRFQDYALPLAIAVLRR